MINLIKNYARQSYDRPQQPLAISPRVNTSTSTTAKALGAVVAGCSEVAVFHPVDTIIKGKMNNSKILNSNQGVNLATLRRLYSGIGFGLAYKVTQRVYKMAGQGAVQQTMVGSTFDHWLTNNVGEVNRKMALGALSGAMVGAGEVVLLPLDRLKIQRQINPDSTSQLREVLSPQGLRAAYRGVGITLLRNIPGSAGFFAGNNSALAAMNTNQKEASILQFCAASLIGSTISLAVSNPADVIKVRVQAATSQANLSTLGTIRNIIVNEGPRAFFNGLGTKLMTITPKLVFSMTIAQKAGATISGLIDQK